MERKRKHVRAVVKRRLSQEAESESAAPLRKRRRTKSYVTLMQIDNMLRISAGKRLSDFVVRVDPDTGQIDRSIDLWTIPSLSLATDSGPDCVGPLACQGRSGTHSHQGQ